MAKLFYNFCFPDGEDDAGDLSVVNHGFYYLSHTEHLLYSHTEFNIPDGIYQNIFQVKLQEDQVLAYKHNDGGWVNVESGQYPTSAYPLLLPKLTTGSFRYTAISEDSGDLLGRVKLERIGNDIIETLDDQTGETGKIMRRFVMSPDKSDDVPISIDWGGATSFLCKDADEAVKGTNLTISQDILFT